MAAANEVQVSQFLDEHGVGSFQIKLILWTIIIAMIDGYDIGAVAFAAPRLIAEWHVPPKELGLVLSASNIGVLFGSQIFGWVGDRYGRKTSLILCNLLFGVFTFIAAYSTNLTEMTWLRLIAGLGIGGVIPNIVAINAEIRPAQQPRDAGHHRRRHGAARRRARRLCQRRSGAELMAGRCCSISAASCQSSPRSLAIMGLPESIKYMALHESQRSKMEALITAIRPGYKVPPDARFVVEDEQQSPSSNPIHLFGNGLAAITPLTWLMFALNLMGYFFLISWTPTLMTAAHATPQVAALSGAAIQVGGTVGALVLCWWLQRHRFLAIAILFVIAVPIVASIGYAGLSSTTALLIAAFLAGALVLGIQSGINVVGALIYPTSLRANGSGWQLGLGRIGAIIGPFLGAMFVGLPVEQLYAWSSLPFAVGAVVAFIIYVLNAARIRARPELAKAQ